MGIYIENMTMPEDNDEMIEIVIFGNGTVIQTGESWRSPEDEKCYYRPTTPEKFFHAYKFPSHELPLIDADEVRNRWLACEEEVLFNAPAIIPVNKGENKDE